MKKLILLFFIFLFFFALYIKRFYLLSSFLSIPCEILIDKKISENYYKPNNMLYITIENSKGLPIGTKEIINPIFPVFIKINNKDIFFKDLITFNLKITAIMNTYGDIGKLKKGDYYSSQKLNSFIISNKKTILIDSIY